MFARVWRTIQMEISIAVCCEGFDFLLYLSLPALIDVDKVQIDSIAGVKDAANCL